MEALRKVNNLTIQSCPRTEVVAWSLYCKPLKGNLSELRGFSRKAGDASSKVIEEIQRIIINKSQHLSQIDQAALLSIAKLESGFNPDAASKISSAAGVFQFIKSTAHSFGMNEVSVFDAEKNIEAGIKLYEENIALLEKRFPGLEGAHRIAMLYALHHDGPQLDSNGLAIARKHIIPSLNYFVHFVSRQKQSAP